MYLKHYGTKGMHWYERNYQNHDGSLTEAGRLRYLKNARPNATKAFDLTIGKTDKTQQYRYLRWYRSEINKRSNKNKKTIKENVLSRKSEGQNYISGLKTFYDLMRKEGESSVPDKYYNEDSLWKVWHDEYTSRIINPAFERYAYAIHTANNDSEGFENFCKDPKHMKQYGYSDEERPAATLFEQDMAHYAYANYLMAKKKDGYPY